MLFHRPEGASTDLDAAAARIDASVRFRRNWLARARIPDLWVPQTCAPYATCSYS